MLKLRPIAMQHCKSAFVGYCLILTMTLGILGCSSELDFEQQSEYSHIRVRTNGDERTLLFVRENGREVVETRLNLKRPYELQSAYTPFMFASYLVKPEQERVLIIGLGGGAMVQFLKHYAPQLVVDVVEIDPIVAKVADEFFNTRTEGNVNIVIADASEYLATTEHRYDVIYLDAFLPPSSVTDSFGIPLKHKTKEFYSALTNRLNNDGLLVINAVANDSFSDDVKAVNLAMSQAFVFSVPRSRNRVLIGCSTKAPELDELRIAAKTMDARFATKFSFESLLDHLDTDLSSRSAE